MIRTRRSFVSALGGSLLLLCLAGHSRAEVVDRIVAVVNDEVITMSELQNMAKGIEAGAGIKPSAREDRELQKKMLDALIDRKLAKEEAKKRGIKISDKEMEQALAQFRKRNHVEDDEAFNKALSQAGLTMKELKSQIADQIIQQRLLAMEVGSKVIIPDAEVRKVYDAKYKEGGVKLHLLMVKLPFNPGASDAEKTAIKDKAEALLKDVKQGTPLTEAARKLSLQTVDMGFVAQSDIDPRLAEFLGRLKPKEVAPVQTPAGFQMIELVERRSGGGRPYEEVAPEIRQILMQQEMEKQFSTWVKTLRQKAHIKIML